jgi:hypothetical protein
MKRMKAREDFGLLNITATESFEERFTFWAGKLALNAAVGFRVAQSFTPALHLSGADFALWLHFDGKITHERPPFIMVPLTDILWLLIKSTESWSDNPIYWLKTRRGNRPRLKLTLEAT